jgi:hypothetical protein
MMVVKAFYENSFFLKLKSDRKKLLKLKKAFSKNLEMTANLAPK